MASAKECTDGTDLVEKLKKLASVPPIYIDKALKYTINGCGIDCEVTASSAFGAATKFAIWAKEVCGLEESTLKQTNLEVVDVENDRYVYQIVFEHNHPVVELNYVVKSTPVLNNVPANEDNSEKESSTPVVEVDLQTGEIIDSTLRHYFGFGSFRPLQKETIVTTMSGKNVLTILGTGGGKSLTFLLPAVISSKPTVVVSPIKSLIDDILSRCSNLNIAACKFTGDIPKEVYQSQLPNLENFKVVLVTPEIIKNGELLKVLKGFSEKGMLERIVFDEAHTIVSWGNTFRPVYKDVCEQLAHLNCPKLLLSATVPAKVEAGIKDIFSDLTVFKSSVFRENLSLHVSERGTKFYDDLEVHLLQHKDECGIIYCVLPKDVSDIHAELLKRGIDCVKYHGQLSQDVKLTNQTRWINGECKIIVANSSFGMGIDKKDVRFIVHARLPTSIDEYYQQCGRAGRDGLPSTCTLFYKYMDKNMLLKMFIRQDRVGDQIGAVNDLINYLEDPVQCRHRSLMVYFGESKSNFHCGISCDNCCPNSEFYLTDGTNDALKVVQAMVELTGKDITCNTLKLFLLGSKQKSIQEKELDSFSNFGIFKKQFVPAVLLEKFLHTLVYNGVLKENIEQKGKSMTVKVTLGPKAHDLLSLNMSVQKLAKK